MFSLFFFFPTENMGVNRGLDKGPKIIVLPGVSTHSPLTQTTGK